MRYVNESATSMDNINDKVSEYDLYAITLRVTVTKLVIKLMFVPGGQDNRSHVGSGRQFELLAGPAVAGDSGVPSNQDRAGRGPGQSQIESAHRASTRR